MHTARGNLHNSILLVLLQVVLLLRGGCVLLLLLSNAFMWTLFVKALQGCRSTVEVAVANSGSNFIFTVISQLALYILIHVQAYV